MKNNIMRVLVLSLASAVFTAVTVQAEDAVKEQDQVKTQEKLKVQDQVREQDQLKEQEKDIAQKQEKIRAGKVLVIGTGGLGAPVALYLAAAGVGTLGLVDPDNVELSNLQRQVIHFTPDVGKPKVLSASEKIQAINPDVKVVTYQTRVLADNIAAIVKDYDFVIDGTDNFPTRYLVNDACVLLKKVNKLIILPENEVPTIATVTDKSKVNNQIFFAKSENGDKALIYTQAKKAFLYRPATDKIIEVMPINIESSTSAKTLVLPISISTSPPTSKTKPSETEKPNPKIAVYNGTKTTGLAKQSEEEINKEISEAEVIVTDNAKGNYKETQIIDITGGNIEIVKKLNSMFSGKVIKSLPDGESDGGADIVILLGGE